MDSAPSQFPLHKSDRAASCSFIHLCYLPPRMPAPAHTIRPALTNGNCRHLQAHAALSDPSRALPTISYQIFPRIAL